MTKQGTAAPPVAPRDDYESVVHGDAAIDNYFWLRDIGNPQVMAYLKAEDAYADAVMKPTAAVQDALYTEMVGPSRKPTPPCPTAAATTSTTREPSRAGNIPFIAENALTGRGGRGRPRQNWPRDTIQALGSYRPSDDGTLLAFATDHTGYRRFTLRVKDLRSGALPPNGSSASTVVWASDNKTAVLCDRRPGTKRQNKFFRHVVAPDKQRARLRRAGRAFRIDVTRTRDGAITALQIAAKTTTEFRSCRQTRRRRRCGWSCRAARTTSTTSTIAGPFYIARKGRNFASSPRRSTIPREGNWASWSPIVPT